MSFVGMINMRLNDMLNRRHIVVTVLPFLKPFMNVSGPKIRTIIKIKRTTFAMVSYEAISGRNSPNAIDNGTIGLMYSEYAESISALSMMARGLLIKT